MNEERPVREFLKGCAVDIGVLLVLCALLGTALFLLLWAGTPSPEPPQAGTMRAGAAACAVVALLVFLFWVRLCVRAFKSERRYYFSGLMSFLPITFLFFGTCQVLAALFAL
ncbi:MAG TPA: hypothetical protein PL005_12880 [Candidatus Hydrogenedentes bacterium]|nr:hypothetical protein [Candidatus Hydrogenedentota bacterium]